MKAGLFLAAIGALAHLADALPTPEGAVVIGVVFEDVEIWVDPAGDVESKTTLFSTSYEQLQTTPAAGQPSSSTSVDFLQTSTPTPAGSASLQSSSVAAVQSSASSPQASPTSLVPSPSTRASTSTPVAPPPSSTPVAQPSSVAPASSAASSAPTSSPSSTGFASGISYSPYTSDGGCKTASQVSQDLAQLTSYSVIRLYGTDCNQVANALAALKGHATQIFAGIFDVSQVTPETQSLIAQVAGAWSSVNTVSVGNEAVNDGIASAAAVAAAVGTARGLLRPAGFSGPVVTVDTMVASQANPQLCAASDYCAINCHAFFDGGVGAQQAGEFVRGWVAKVQAVAPGKQVVVTESGWPSQGSANGAAVPSLQNQQAAVASLKAAFPADLVLYAAYNNYWQANSATTYGTEHYWGILGNAPCGA